MTPQRRRHMRERTAAEAAVSEALGKFKRGLMRRDGLNLHVLLTV